MSERVNQTLELVDPSSEILNRVAEDVPIEKIKSPEIQTTIDQMFAIAYGEQGDKERRTMVGLAGPQVGVNKRIIIAGVNAVGSGEQPELRAYINPVITHMSKETVDGREGCYSTGRVCGIVSRSKTITVVAYNREGELVEETYHDFPARVFQHEVGHTFGVRFADLITDDSKLHWVPLDRFGEYRKNWANWDELCPRERWEAIKNGTFSADTDI